MYKGFNSYVEDSIKKNWDKMSLSDYKGVTYQYKDIARKIEKIHILLENAGQTTIKVTNGATLTVTDKAVLTSTVDSGKHYTVIVEKGCFAILSAEAQKAFKIEGEGTVLTYVDGKSEIFTHYLGNNWN